MGMFDRVWADCPKCGKRVEFQSKAGECLLRDFHIDNLPPEIAKDIANDSNECDECGYKITFLAPTISRVRLVIKDSFETDYD
jgi:hypothetical protein